jgi:hypothetical protein
MTRQAIPKGTCSRCWARSQAGERSNAIANKYFRARSMRMPPAIGAASRLCIGPADMRVVLVSIAELFCRTGPVTVDSCALSNRSPIINHRMQCVTCRVFRRLCLHGARQISCCRIPSAGSEHLSRSPIPFAGQDPVGKRHAGPLEILSGALAT